MALSHASIVTVREMVVGDTMDQVDMVMAHFDHDLKSCLKRHEGPLPQADAKSLCLQFLSGIRHMRRPVRSRAFGRPRPLESASGSAFRRPRDVRRGVLDAGTRAGSCTGT